MTGRTFERRVKLTDRLAAKGPRKLLAMDGGGIRGVISLMILGKIEKLLIEESKRRTIGLPTILTMYPALVPAESLPRE